MTTIIKGAGWLAILALLLLSACDDEDTDGPADVDGADVSDVSDAAPDIPDTTGDPDTGEPVSVCQAEGGICVSSATDCTDGGGAHAPEGDGTCVFDDGAGVCCVPPAAQATGDTCRARGGLCAPIAGCNFVEGSFAPPTEDCNMGPVIICCLPESICGEETEVCCGESTAFRPSCDRGTFDCDLFSDTTLVPEAECTF